MVARLSPKQMVIGSNPMAIKKWLTGVMDSAPVYGTGGSGFES